MFDRLLDRLARWLDHGGTWGGPVAPPDDVEDE